MQGAVNAQGKVAAWKHFQSSTSIAAVWDKNGKEKPEASEFATAAFIPYDTPNFHVEYALEQSGVQNGQVSIHRIVYAGDCGRPVNPAGVVAQVESAAVYALSAMTKDAITIDRGRVVQSNFNDYDMPRMKDMPKIEVHVVMSKEDPTGIGEPGLPVVAPAVGNAVFAATGKRLRRLPIKPEDLA